MATLDGLNAFSARFATQLFERHPEWRDHAHLDADKGGHTLRLSVVAPSGAQLQVRTYGDQITIDFGPDWHEHIGEWSGADEPARFGKALELIDGIVSGKTVIVTRYVFGRRAWSRAMPITEVRRSILGRIDVMSWTGKRGAPLSGL